MALFVGLCSFTHPTDDLYSGPIAKARAGNRLIKNTVFILIANVTGQARVLPSPGPAGWDPRPFLSSSPAPHRCLRVRCRAIGRLDHGAIMITIKITIMNGPDLPHDPNLNPNRNPFPPFRFPTCYL